MTVSIVMTLRDETQERVDRVMAAATAQIADAPVEIVVALSPADRARLRLPQDVVVVDNASGARSPGLNAAVAAARGDIVCRLDARSLPPTDYVVRCAARLAADRRVGVVGGVQRPRATTSDVVSAGIARALANPWALGGAAYRRPDSSGPTDTVYLGAYRRAELIAIGGFDDRLEANEDFDLCQRYRANGQLVWLEPGLVVDYEPRATVADLWHQYEAFGRAKVRYWRLSGGRPNARQSVALTGGAAGLVVAVIAARRPERAAAAVALGLGAAVALDHVAAPDEPRIAVRAIATASYAVIAGGWLAGAAREALAASARDSR